jgi:hypothetical protein
MYETEDGRERTYYTLHLYLNDTKSQPSDEPLEGGATTFWSYSAEQRPEKRLDVQPMVGSVLVFQQKHLLHAGDDVIRGTKLTLRTELLYEKSDELAPTFEDLKSRGKSSVGWLGKRVGATK